MERLSGVDATFLYLETPTSHMHVCMTAIFDAASMADGYSFEHIREHIRQRLPLLPPFTQRLMEVPLGLHHPVWVTDPNFSIDYHVRRVGCPAPGGRRELAELAAQIASVPLDRSRPLWEIWVIEGLRHNRFGFVAKVHHAAIDGASGAELMTSLLDLEPNAQRNVPPLPEPERIPSDQELVAHALTSKLRNAAEVLPLATRTLQSVTNVIRNRQDPHGTYGGVPLTAPRTPWNAAITQHRRVAFARIPLEPAKRVKDVAGVKLNDVVLATVAGMLRRYLVDRDALPEDPLLAVCPISVRTDDDTAGGNKVSAMFTSLATDVPDPAERLQAIARATQGAKNEHHAVGANMLTDWGELAAGRTFALASRMYSSMKLADRHRPIHNLIISNVPGPPFPLYFAGAELIAAYPMGPIHEGAGLNVTVLSYLDSIDLGIMCCRELVPDVWDMAGVVGEAFAELEAAVLAGAPVKASRRTRSGGTKPKRPAKRVATKAAAQAGDRTAG